MKRHFKRILTAVAALSLCGSGLSAQEKPVPLSDSLYRSLAATPPMGWNSWNKFGCNVSEKLIKEIADAMAASGMADAGYEYIVIDDCWQVERDADGNIVPDPERFPSGMKALADYIHDLGLKFGVYSCAGSLTCQGRPGSKGHQFQDALQYAKWGVDYLKYDWCSNDGQNAKAAYQTMSEAIKASGRPIVLSICEWGENKPWEWGEGIGHLWRVTPDIRACYDCAFDWGGVGVLQCIDAAADLYPYAGPGHWNDAEMLEVGNGELTWDESVTHFSMWCMLAAPLMSGNDLREMDYKTLQILTNKEVIAVNQDPLGKQGIRFMDMGDQEIWAKPLANGEIAVCFLNRSANIWNLDYNWLNQTMYFARDINFRKKEYTVRDLWAHKDLGTSKDRLKAAIPGHGVLMVRLSPKKADPVALPKGKAIYIAEDERNMDWNDPESKWSYHRMYCTPNVAIFWEKGFGDDPAKAPEADGHDMTWNLPNLAAKLEEFYKVYADDMKFILPGSKTEKYRMNCYVLYEYKDETAYGGCVDDMVGGLWLTPGRIRRTDELNVVAHELGHCFQTQVMCDGQGDGGGGGLYEMAAQWMLWQVNPAWQTSEKYHWEAWNKLTHKAFMAGENMYHSPYVLEYWSTKHGITVMADIFRAGKRGEDPVQIYKRMFNLSQEQFNAEMFDACRHFVNWDFDRVWKESRPYACKNVTALMPLGDGWMRVAASNCPENYGFNAVPMPVPAVGQTVTVDFRGEAGAEGFAAVKTDKAGWRYGFVAVGKDGKSVYGDMHSDASGTVSYTADRELGHLYLVVMGAPSEHWPNPFGRGRDPEPVAQWPYSIRIR